MRFNFYASAFFSFRRFAVQRAIYSAKMLVIKKRHKTNFLRCLSREVYTYMKNKISWTKWYKGISILLGFFYCSIRTTYFLWHLRAVQRKTIFCCLQHFFAYKWNPLHVLPSGWKWSTTVSLLQYQERPISRHIPPARAVPSMRALFEHHP